MITYVKFINAVALPAANGTEYSASREKHKLEIVPHRKYPGVVITGKTSDGKSDSRFVPWANIVQLTTVEEAEVVSASIATKPKEGA